MEKILSLEKQSRKAQRAIRKIYSLKSSFFSLQDKSIRLAIAYFLILVPEVGLSKSLDISIIIIKTEKTNPRQLNDIRQYLASKARAILGDETH